MKIRSIFLFSLFTYSYAFAEPIMLPDPMPIFTNGIIVTNHPVHGFRQKSLPVINDFIGEKGCYLACYSHDSLNGVYSVGRSTFVVGLIRIPGNYFKNNCIPQNYSGRTISTEQTFKDLCGQKFPACGTACWAGTDTGGWFGVQKIQVLE